MNNSLRVSKVNYIKDILCKASALVIFNSNRIKMKQLPELVIGCNSLPHIETYALEMQ